MASDYNGFMQGTQISTPRVYKGNLPIDAKTISPNKQHALDNLPPTSRFEGLFIYCIDEGCFYSFQGGILNDNFMPISGGSGSLTPEQIELLAKIPTMETELANKQIKLITGDNVKITEDGLISAIDTIYDDTEVRELIDTKQDILTTGDNIDITNNIISAVDTIYDDTEVKNLIEAKIDKTAMSTILDDTSTEDTVPTSKTVYDKLLDMFNKANKPSYKVIDDLALATDTSYIYLILNASNIYKMYIVQDDGTTKYIGTMEADFSDYYTKTEVDAKDTALDEKIATKQDTLTAGYLITIGDDNTIAVNETELQALLDAKQDKLIAGDNITIDVDNTISASGTGGDYEDRITALEEALEELTYVKIKINSFTNNVGTVEIGTTITDVTLNWTTNKTPTTLKLDGTDITPTDTSKALTGLTITSDKSYTLVATDDKSNSSSATTSIKFLNGVYYGACAEGTYDSAFILGLTRKLQSSKAITFTVSANAGQYIYYALPSSYGASVDSFSVGGFVGGFSKVNSIEFTNASGHTTTYDIYRSVNDGLGNTTVVVS